MLLYVKKPHWDLAAAKALCVTRDGLALSKTRAVAFFPSLAEAYACARSTVAGLSAASFVETLHQNPDVRDVYAVKNGGKGWYVKFTILSGPGNDKVFMLSLHPLEREIRLANGKKVVP